MRHDQYKTKDLAESAALILKKQKLIRIDKKGSICTFVFEDSQTCESISNEFFFGNLKVKAREYHETLSILKLKIFST